MFTLAVPTEGPRSREYVHKRRPDEVRCYYVVNPASPHAGWALREIIRPAFRALHADYGLTAAPLAYGELPPPRDDAVTYVIYGPTNPLTMAAPERQYLAALARGGARTNIISAYPLTAAGRDRPGYRRARTAVPRLCDELDINAIFPDELDLARGIRTNTWHDVYVNVIGETIRVKYRPVRSDDPADEARLAALRREHTADVAELARLHREFRLWQRKPYTDGSLMFVHDGQWLVSQTMTDKTLMTPDDFDLVTGYDERLDSVTYTGARLPSSDVPEFLVLADLLARGGRRPRLIAHFHHRRLTRDPRFRRLVSDTTIECGLFAAGHRFLAELRARDSDWFIIREHGVVWVGESTAHFADFAARVAG
ncbi:hypothetical protein [Dactylosporangium sp. CA-092794]|uniref:hypothetical protein n=1 Tax=Dactylosporangium sp. CA-092794 TaxID=3239929 RepID=UPI003D92470D